MIDRGISFPYPGYMPEGTADSGRLAAPDGKAQPSARVPGGGKASDKGSGGLWRKFADLFTSADPEKEKRRELKAIARTLRKINNKLYNPKSEQVLPGLGKLFFEFYRTLGPAQTLLAHAKSSNVLKSILIESSLNKDQAALKERLSEQAIRERMNNAPGQSTIDELKNDLKTFSAIFDVPRIRLINDQYKSLAVLLHLVHFDYYMLLRKFDPQLREGDYLATPHFEPTSAQYIEDELKDFLEILPALDPLEDWNALWGILKAYRGSEPVTDDAWRRLQALIRRLAKTGELEMVAQLITGNPYLKPNPRIYHGNIVDEYLTTMRADTEATLQKVAKEKRGQNIEALIKEVYGEAVPNRLANYTEDANQQMSKKMLGGYTFAVPLNYLHAFLTDCIKKEMTQALDTILIRGKWSDPNLSQILSESYHQLLAIADELEAFDRELAPDSEQGRRLASVVSRADKDRQRAYLARRLMNKVNETARSLVLRSGQNCVTIGKMLKQVVDDVSRGKPQLIINWAEITGRSQRALKDQLAAHYKKLYYFVQLMKLFV
jgi:hypothetical protein